MFLNWWFVFILGCIITETASDCWRCPISTLTKRYCIFFAFPPPFYFIYAITWFLEMAVFSLNCHIMKVFWPIFHRCFGLNSGPLDLTQVVNVRNENAHRVGSRKKQTFRRGLILVSCICSCLYYFSSITLIFAQVSGGLRLERELKSIHLWRQTHGIYYPDPVSKGQLFFLE